MTEKRDVIRRLQTGQYIRQINRETGIHRTIVRELHKLSESKGWLKPGRKLPTEHAISKSLEQSRSCTKEKTHPLSRFHNDIKIWLKEK